MQLLLKSLELQGYKTFASRTQFEFSSSITAIIGPNGSGKSNIADSIRWVLGEQSYSLLRGKRTEDMIYTGSEIRARAGMASASITFDNSTGWLPIDYSEVSITRRAFRDGQNEYLLNGQRVRLKDISELLAQSGLAERTYTIIGQGLVDTALAIRPEERRLLFEEAAGISLHRNRREEAIRRLEVTRRNLDRALDIVAELTPRLRSLERQAKRAQEYEHVKAELKELLREWYGYHWHRVQQELIESREAVRIHDQRVDAARKDLIGIQEKLSEIRNRHQAIRTDVNLWLKELGSCHTLLEEYNRKLAVSDERERSLKIQQETINSNLTRLVENITINSDRISAITKDINDLESELEDASIQREAELKILQLKQADRKQLEIDYQAAQSDYTRLVNNQIGLDTKLTEMQIQVSRKEFQINQTVLQNEQKNKEVEKLKDDYRNFDDNHNKKKKRIDDIQKQQNRLREEFQGNQNKLHQELEESLSLETAISRLDAEIAVLTQAESSLLGYSSGTKLLLEAKKKAEIKGIIGALSQIIEVPSEFELAITAALGDYLDAVILENGYQNALDFLVKKDVKGVLLPVERIEIIDQDDFPFLMNKGVLGMAMDKIKVTEQIRYVIQLIFRNIILVETRAIAIDLIEKFKKDSINRGSNSDEIILVTLIGEVISSRGQVVYAGGGKSTQTLLGRSRRIQELSDQLDLFKSQLSSKKAQIALIRSMQSDITGKVNKLGDHLRQASKEEESDLSKLLQLQKYLDSAQNQLQFQKDQIKQLKNEIGILNDEIHTAVEKSIEIKDAISRTKETVESNRLKLAESSLEVQLGKVANWNTVIAVINKSLEEAKERLSERKQDQGQLFSSKENLTTKMNEIQNDLRKLMEDVSDWKIEEKNLLNQITLIRQKIDPAEEEIHLLENKQHDLEQLEHKAHQSLNIIEQNASQVRINHSRRQDALENLQRRTEEDFGLVSFEYESDISGRNPLPFEGMVEQLPVISNISPDTEEAIRRTRSQLMKIGVVNPEALVEYKEVTDRFQFLSDQINDLENAENNIRKVVQELDLLMQKEFFRTYQAVAREFREIFSRLFHGGAARLILSNPDNLTETGVEIEARLPGRRTQGLSLLSGGERSLTAIALIFSLLKVSPTPFCLLDEVDAMLDEANVGRYCELLQELSQNTQFIIVTHNRSTVQVADYIYGVTLGKDLASQVLSLKADEIYRVIGEDN